jgi:hypothetical protein
MYKNCKSKKKAFTFIFHYNTLYIMEHGLRGTGETVPESKPHQNISTTHRGNFEIAARVRCQVIAQNLVALRNKPRKLIGGAARILHLSSRLDPKYRDIF